ncbi:MAG: NAD(P)H-hydrate dehydratase [Candidatus Schekmanbacteria bacterium]|nr:NAD(P)H-hydrate dehydratase [Candidatus Schekmanbacteria bacterium]
MKVVTSHVMQRLDREAIELTAIPGLVLMENAGLRAADAILDVFRESGAGAVSVVCGKGNNGGDGFVIARHLANRGASVRVFVAADPATLQGEALGNYVIAQKMGLEIRQIASPEELEQNRADLLSCDVLVDALLGTGLRAAATGVAAAIIAVLRASDRPICAVDVPSGVSSDTGQIIGPAVAADLTVTFGLPKVGLAVYPAAALAGRVRVVDISLPAAVLAGADTPYAILLPDEWRWPFPPRSLDIHKGKLGKLLVVATSRGFTGAGIMASHAAMRMGAGLVTIACPASCNNAIEPAIIEAMTAPMPETDQGTLSAEAREAIIDLSDTRDAVLLGPGLGAVAETRRLALDILSLVNRPMVVDADGLNALAADPDALQRLADPPFQSRQLVLTPHHGEAARLLGTPVTEVSARQLESALELARRSGATVVLKGHRSVVAAPDGRASINTTGNPGMATGGMGDVLTGIIGAFLGRGLAGYAAAVGGTYLHGLAGDRAAARLGQESLIATDLLGELPALLRHLTSAERTASRRRDAWTEIPR